MAWYQWSQTLSETLRAFLANHDNDDDGWHWVLFFKWWGRWWCCLNQGKFIWKWSLQKTIDVENCLLKNSNLKHNQLTNKWQLLQMLSPRVSSPNNSQRLLIKLLKASLRQEVNTWTTFWFISREASAALRRTIWNWTLHSMVLATVSSNWSKCSSRGFSLLPPSHIGNKSACSFLFSSAGLVCLYYHTAVLFSDSEHQRSNPISTQSVHPTYKFERS